MSEPTRRKTLEVIASDGPITASILAKRLGVTSTAIRRHLALLEADGTVIVHDPPGSRQLASRGRPARAYVVNPAGRSGLANAYPDLAASAIAHLRDVGGAQAVQRFAASYAQALARKVAEHVVSDDPATRAAQLAAALTDEGFAGSVRPLDNLPMLQLCQGHCPVRLVARENPELCEAETAALASLMGTHAVRIATIASGAHACVTNVPVGRTP
jgi:predicted ArsR family transcriptional regulator